MAQYTAPYSYSSGDVDYRRDHQVTFNPRWGVRLVLGKAIDIEVATGLEAGIDLAPRIVSTYAANVTLDAQFNYRF